jgi:hypothetical protein
MSTTTPSSSAPSSRFNPAPTTRTTPPRLCWLFC